ncbi:hypothetical protein NM208_g14264 [Fusarium decemcellulare]|uniref:Uncharacterized protein n=1 Tax=Fusarium decemcellulare TaxID=57161 RepID=A0ACC1RK59_9HYPO|nr:hypothetical protein NM208_g14264 [Fusarium decemcellulare]
MAVVALPVTRLAGFILMLSRLLSRQHAAHTLVVSFLGCGAYPVKVICCRQAPEVLWPNQEDSTIIAWTFTSTAEPLRGDNAFNEAGCILAGSCGAFTSAGLTAKRCFLMSMDPLSAAASIVGLVTAVGKLYTLLDYVSSVRNAPATIRDAKDEVGHAQLALRSMERCLNRLASLNPDRTALIQVDDLRVTLADAMMAFSEFEALLRDLTRLARLRAAIAWPKYAKAMEDHLVKVQRYKSSLTLMLNILQCETQIEASESQERLHALIESVMEENQVLKQMMNDSQDSFDARSTFSRRHLDDRSTIWLGGDDEEDDAATIRTSNTIATIQGLRNGFQSKVMALTFEKILEQSWVYKRNQRNECDSSFISTAGRSHAWSVFSGFSLADVSVLSVIAMPLTTLDLSNGKHYDIEVRDGDSTGPTGGLGISDTSISQPRYLPSLELEDFEFPWTTRHQEEDQLRQQIDEARSNALMVLSGAYDGKDTRITPPVSDEDNKLVGSNDKRPEDDASDNKSDEEDGDEALWPCQGCKQILEEGKAYALGKFSHDTFLN